MLQDRRKKALLRLEKQLENNHKPLESARLQAGEKVMQPLEKEDVPRIKKEISILKDRLSGVKKSKVKRKGQETIASPDKWVIDIFAIHYGYVKNSVRRKNKGASRKKMKKQKSSSFLKTVTAQPGVIQKYREGLMGLSPKTHSFRMRKLEDFTY